MNWHETILHIQGNPHFSQLIDEAYLSQDLALNCTRFRASEEFKETLAILHEHVAKGASILDVGAGNGIATIALAQSGFEVTALEPDESTMVGVGAIEHLKKELGLENIAVHQATTETASLQADSFDAIYVRQAVHHADDLLRFMAKLSGLVKPGGIILTTRDHEVNGEAERNRFLAAHPLHTMYGGEYAYTQEEYERAFRKAGLEVVERWTHFETAINFAPKSRFDVQEGIPDPMKAKLRRRIGPIAEWKMLQSTIRKHYDRRGIPLYDEQQVVGRLVSYLLKRPVQ